MTPDATTRFRASLAVLRLAALFNLSHRLEWRVTKKQFNAAIASAGFANVIAETERAARRNRWMPWRRAITSAELLQMIKSIGHDLV